MAPDSGEDLNVTTKEHSHNRQRILSEILALTLLLISVLMPFIGPLSRGETLSKLSLIRDIDLTQDSNKTFAIHGDPSAATTHVPNEMYIEQSDELALWNPLNGAGRPIIGDFQTLIFSFFHIYFPSNNAHLATLEILLKIALSATGAYIFSRRLALSRIASIAVGQAFALAQHCLSSEELCNNFCFYPYLLVATVWAFSRPSPTRIVLLAGICAASAYNMHPETFVCGVAVALLFAFIRTLTMVAKAEFRQRFIDSTIALICVCTLTFILAAPLILPFCEFIANGVSYKFVDTKVDFVNLFSFVSNLIAPFSSASNFVGTALFLCLPIGLVQSWRKHRCVFYILALVVLFTTRPGFLEALLGQKPISFLLPEYVSYFCILFSAITAGIGLDCVRSTDAKFRTKSLWYILSPAAVLILTILLNSKGFCDLWSACTNLEYSGNYSVFSSTILIFQALTLFAFLLLIITQKANFQKWSKPISIAIVLLNSIPLMEGASQALPGSKPFWYHNPEIVSLLKRKQEPLSFRSTATGDHLLQPNTNLIYAFDDFRCTAPLHPRRYANFVDACGIKSRNCNIYTSPYELNDLYNIASVNLIASDAPVHSADPTLRALETGTGIPYKYEGGQVKIRPGLRLEDANFVYFPLAKEIIGQADVTIHLSGRFTYYYQWTIMDEAEKILWHSSWQESSIEQSGQSVEKHKYKIAFQAAVPSTSKSKALRIILCIRSGSSVDNPNWHDRSLALTRINVISSNDLPHGQVIRLEDCAENQQIYQNRGALRSAYLVHKIDAVNSETSALKLLNSKKINFNDTAIIETAGQLRTLSPPEPRATPDLVRVLARDSNNVSIMAVSTSPSYLLLTDTFYPGWKVFVDGNADTIYPANYAFRAVYLKAGKHFIRFVYNPTSFKLGLELFYCGLAIVLVILILQAFQSIKKRKAD